VFRERALLHHVPWLWLQPVQHGEDRASCACGSPVPEQLWAQHYPQQRHHHHWCSASNLSNQWCGASLQAHPRRGRAELNPLRSSTSQPSAVQDPACLREEADGKGEPSHWVLVRLVCTVWLVQPALTHGKGLCKGTKSSFMESEHINGNR